MHFLNKKAWNDLKVHEHTFVFSKMDYVTTDCKFNDITEECQSRWSHGLRLLEHWAGGYESRSEYWHFSMFFCMLSYGSRGSVIF
jgi:hypothetical protein